MKGDYEDFQASRRRKTKPNKANLGRKYCIRVIVEGLFELYQGDPVFAGLTWWPAEAY